MNKKITPKQRQPLQESNQVQLSKYIKEKKKNKLQIFISTRTGISPSFNYLFLPIFGTETSVIGRKVQHLWQMIIPSV